MARARSTPEAAGAPLLLQAHESDCPPGHGGTSVSGHSFISAMVGSPSSSSQASVSVSASFSLADCAWLGFDLDHCLARYNLSTFGPLVYELVLTHLVQRQHMSASLLDVPFDASFAGKGVAFDTLTGHVIKLDAEGRVRVAMHGLSRLSAADVAAAYPAPLLSLDDDRRFLVVHSQFEAACPHILSHLVSRVDAGTLFAPASAASGASAASSTCVFPYAFLVASLVSAFEFEFGSWERGGYFAALRADVGRYIHRRPEVRDWLTGIRQQRRSGLFLCTNSRWDYAELLCRHILGEQWQSLFDFVVVDAAKPAFFAPQPAAPFYRLDCHSFAADAKQPLPFDQPLPRGLYVHGNAKQLTLSLRTARPADARPVVYFDDNLHSGAAAIRRHCPDWLAAAVVEELATDTAAAVTPGGPHSRSQSPLSVYAGPLSCPLFGHPLRVCDDSSYWAHKLQRTAHLSLACFSDISHVHAAGQHEQWVADGHGHMRLQLHSAHSTHRRDS